MLIKMGDPFRDGFGQAKLARDIGTARAAGLDEFVDERLAVADDVADRLRAAEPARARRGVLQHEFERLADAAVDQFEALLEQAVIGAVDFGDARGVAAAAQILHQHGEINV